MAFIPADARWYIAEVVLEHRIEGDPRNVVHINTHLIEASSPDEAHRKAVALGNESDHEYANTSGQLVSVCFRGLRDLNVVHDPLEDGAELFYEESVDVPEDRLSAMIAELVEMSIFAPIDPKADVPNYMPASVMEILEALGRGECPTYDRDSHQS